MISMRQSGRMSEAYIEVLDVLNYLRDSAGEVSMRVQGDDNAYPGVITALNAKHRVMVVDSQFESERVRLHRGKPVILRADSQGREITFQSKFIGSLVPNLNIGYQMQIPKSLGTTQPRAAFRVFLDGIRNKIDITLLGTENQPIAGVVRNLSRLGLGMNTDAELPSAMEGKSRVVDCNMRLQDEDEINCKIEIRNIKALNNDKPHTFIGGRMLEISKRDGRILADYIERLQREYMASYA